jgi:cardiolipin synthase A/B
LQRWAAYVRFAGPGMSLTSFPVPTPVPASAIELLSTGAGAFARILSRIDHARRSIRIRCFEWRDDDTGQSIARALLAAADRGVEVTIFKDRLGGFYEHLAGTKQSFFHKEINFEARWQLWGLMAFYGRWGSLRQRPSALAEALLGHPNVRIEIEKRFDHAKLFVFDDQIVILGGMGIGDDFRNVNVDFMVEISGREAVDRLSERYAGRVRFDPERPFDYLLHSSQGNVLTGESLGEQRLALIARARKRLTIAMAYLGDPAATRALCQAVERGVSVTLLTAARADVGGDLNLFNCAQILKRTGSPENLRLVLHPTMVHGKAIVGDGEWVDLGSTNFTRLSHEGYEELDIFSRDRSFARRVEQTIEHEAAAGTRARLPLDYRLWRLGFEALISAFQTGRPKARR